jgi:dihydroorotate dehydrogenase (NAD+) catalytic subunit
MLSTRVGGLELGSPLMTGSGTFGHDPLALSFLKEGDLGALVLKTVTPEPRTGNSPARMAEFPGGLLNSIGLENRGLEYWKESVAPLLEEVAVPVVGNAGGHTIEDFVAVSEAFSGMEGIAAVELNLSCPNVDGGLHFSTRADSAAEVVSACRRVLDKPLWVKLSPNVTDTVPLARACEESGADALTVCNTLLGLLVDWKTRKPLLGRGYGGVSGPAVLPIAMRLVHQVSSSVSIPVIASGGASRPEDVLAFLVAGASAVQIGTASFRRPDAISTIAAGMRSLLQKNGLVASDLVGSLKWDGGGEKPREN